MSEKNMTLSEIASLIGEQKALLWQKLCEGIERVYDMDTLGGDGGKKWDYEYKYRRGGKTLCALYAKRDTFGFMVIFGKAEREAFEAARDTFGDKLRLAYDEAHTFHDGKWVMFYPEEESEIREFIRLLEIKRKPNRK